MEGPKKKKIPVSTHVLITDKFMKLCITELHEIARSTFSFSITHFFLCEAVMVQGLLLSSNLLSNQRKRRIYNRVKVFPALRALLAQN